MDAHGREYLAAAAGMAETYGGAFPPVGSIVWHRYGAGVSCGKVLAVEATERGVVVRVQRSQTETLAVGLDEIEAAPRFFMGAERSRPEVGHSVWFAVAGGGQSRGVVEAVSPDGLGLLVRETESGQVVEVALSAILPF